MSKIRDLTNERFGRLIPFRINKEKSKKIGRTVWDCKCDCGNIVSVRRDNLVSGTATSCGCYKRESTIQRCTKHNELELFPELGFGRCYYDNSDEYFKFSLEDIDIVRSQCWHKNCNGYPITNVRLGSINTEKFFHRAIMVKHYGCDAVNGKLIDHMSHDISDNTIDNVRICTYSENTRYKITKGSNSGYRNIYLTDNGRYEFKIKINNEPFYEIFDDINDAILYRDNFYIEHGIENYVYKSEYDKRTINNTPIIPFFNINNNQDIIREVINPFIILDKDKLN